MGNLNTLNLENSGILFSLYNQQSFTLSASITWFTSNDNNDSFQFSYDSEDEESDDNSSVDTSNDIISYDDTDYEHSECDGNDINILKSAYSVNINASNSY